MKNIVRMDEIFMTRSGSVTSFYRFPWVAWAIANAIGGAIIGALESGGLEFFATLILTGFVLGAAQWCVLHLWIPKPIAWIATSAAGWILGIYLTINLSNALTPIANFLWLHFGAWEVLWLNIVNEPVTLLIFGVAQWWVLRRYFVKAYGWIVISAIAGLLKGATGAIVCAIACQSLPAVLAGAIADGSAWLAYGLITGILLKQLIGRET